MWYIPSVKYPSIQFERFWSLTVLEVDQKVSAFFFYICFTYKKQKSETLHEYMYFYPVTLVPGCVIVLCHPIDKKYFSVVIVVFDTTCNCLQIDLYHSISCHICIY